MNRRVAKISQNNHHLYFSLLGVTIILLLFLYMYFLSATVVHVVLRKQAITATANVESKISQLEAAYISNQNLVSEKIVSTKDFSEHTEKIFVSRVTPTVAMSNGNF